MGNKKAVLSLLCCGAIALSGTAAHAQSGGITAPGGTAPPTAAPPPATQASGSWTVYKKATWYGPGFWNNETACGQILTKATIGVAHKRLPCGTQVTFSYGGRSVAATVIDRGPYNKGYAWDLTKKTAKKLGFLEVGAGTVTATVTPPAP
jgi:rare lipoprotein A (peptidoglycan hydrolase)